MLENRSITYRIFPDLLPRNNVRSVKDYPDLLLKNLVNLANRQKSDPTVVLLTPGIYNSAYFEHTTLARMMGIEPVVLALAKRQADRTACLPGRRSARWLSFTKMPSLSDMR